MSGPTTRPEDNPIVQQIMGAFPGAWIYEVRDLPPTEQVKEQDMDLPTADTIKAIAETASSRGEAVAKFETALAIGVPETRGITTRAMDFGPSKFEPFAAMFQDHIDEMMEMANMEKEPRDYLGGSRLGEECLRMLGYEYSNAPKDEDKNFSGQTLRIFDMGHDAETRMAQYLRDAGFSLVTHKADGVGQIGFYVAKDSATGKARIAGHLDGVATAGPHDMGIKYPCLWENKGLNAKGITELKKNGLKKTKPVYYAQMQTYMGYLDLMGNPGLFTAINRESGAIYAELIPFDPAAAQAATDRGVAVISAASPEELPRIAAKEDDYRCKFCSYKERCWKAPAASQGAVQAPTWFLDKPAV